MSLTSILKNTAKSLIIPVAALSFSCGQELNLAPFITYYNPSNQILQVAEGTSLEFRVESKDPENDPITFKWYLDGQKEKEAPGEIKTAYKPRQQIPEIPDIDLESKTTYESSYLYENIESGSHTIQVEAVDINGNVSSKSWSLDSESNDPPTTPTTTGFDSVYETELLTGTLDSTDPEGDSITYACSPLPTGSSLNENTGDFVWQTQDGDAGNYIMNCYAEDSYNNQSGSKEVNLSVLSLTNPNNAPAAIISVSSLEALVNQEFIVDGTQSYDLDGDYLTYSWSTLTDCNIYTPEGATSAVSCPTSGDKLIKLLVSDGDLSSEDTLTATITEPNNAPVVSAGSDLPDGFDADCFDNQLYDNTGLCASGYNISDNIHAGEDVSLSASASDLDNDPMTYLWSKLSGPGTCSFSAPNSLDTLVSCSLAGDYVLNFKADDGIDYGEDTMNFYVRDNLDPVADAGDGSVGNIAGISVVNLRGSNSYDSDGKGSLNGIVKCEWDYEGDGIYDWSSTTTCDTTHIYNSPGTYYAKLKVTDDDGAVDTDTKYVEVN
jgi:hypothetical protein